ncbi:MAG: hypothetical protein ACRDJ3_03045 [Solirubrobacteraceae bacterium]
MPLPNEHIEVTDTDLSSHTTSHSPQTGREEHAAPTYIALIHGIGTTSREGWAKQSVHALVSWWTNIRRKVDADTVTCPQGCELRAGHRHLQLSDGERSRRIDLEPLFWADYVDRPNRWRCAWLVLQAGLLIGLVDVLSAGLTAFSRLEEGFKGGNVEMARALWRVVSIFGRAVIAPVLTLGMAGAVLVSSRLRATIGDALAWSTDEESRERVRQEMMRLLQERKEGPMVLVGHSQGASIAAELEPDLRTPDRQIHLVTLGSGHGLLAAMHTVLPRWSVAKSLLSWTVVVAFSILAIATLVSGVAPMLHPVLPIAEAPLRVGGYAWLSNVLPVAQTRDLLLHETQIAPSLQSQITHPVYLPPIAIPAEIASTAFAVLLFTIGVEPGRILRAATHTDAPGIDIVATHDLVSAAMLQLGPVERRRPVSQCGSLLFDHTSYLRNGCAVLPLLAGEIERVAGLREHNDDVGEIAMEEYHRAGLTMRAWTRPLLAFAIVAAIGWFAAGRIAPTAWIPAAIACSVAASAAVTVSCARWLGGALRRMDADTSRSVTVESARSRRASLWWAATLGLVAVPLLGGAAIAFTSPRVFTQVARHPALPSLTVVAFIVGVVLCATAWRSLFGFQDGKWTTRTLLLAAALWLSQGTGPSVEVAITMFGLACWSYRRDYRERSASDDRFQPRSSGQEQ